jgi:holo-[acyl-carrier protein] synthase
MKKIFTEKEIEYCENKLKSAQHFAARFAAKEAVVKALSGHGVKINLNKVEILNDEYGIPYVNLFYSNSRYFDIKISLTHSNELTIAFVIINKRIKK